MVKTKTTTGGWGSFFGMGRKAVAAAAENEPRRRHKGGWTEKDIEATITLWALTPAEVEGLRTLKTKLADLVHPKNTSAEVVRFLRARPDSLAEAEAMFRAMIQWRLANKVDTVLDDYQPPALFMDKFPGAILQGRDLDGDPVYVERLGATDGLGLFQRYGRDEMIKHATWIREFVSTGDWIDEYERERGRPVQRVLIIEDLHGLSVRHMHAGLLATYGDIMRLDQDNYPETAKQIIIIRAPLIFRTIWALLKGFMDPGVVAKMTFCGPHDYQKVLAEHVDLAILPREIVPKGKGSVVAGMPPSFQGGRVPQIGKHQKNDKNSQKEKPAETAPPTATQTAPTKKTTAAKKKAVKK